MVHKRPVTPQLGKIRKTVDRVGIFFVDFLHLLALFAIGAATAWAAVYAFLGMLEKSHASVEDLLLLFIYLEIGAMVGIYFKTAHLPVRFLIYVAITALTRLLIGEVGAHHKLSESVIWLTAGVLILAIAELVLRYGKSCFPIDTEVAEISDRPASKANKAAPSQTGET